MLFRLDFDKLWRCSRAIYSSQDVRLAIIKVQLFFSRNFQFVNYHVTIGNQDAFLVAEIIVPFYGIFLTSFEYVA